jgi:excisionase family DNA binding protein
MDNMLLTIQEASKCLNITPLTVIKCIKNGRLVNRGIGNKILLLKIDIEDLRGKKNKK